MNKTCVVKRRGSVERLKSRIPEELVEEERTEKEEESELKKIIGKKEMSKKKDIVKRGGCGEILSGKLST